MLFALLGIAPKVMNHAVQKLCNWLHASLCPYSANRLFVCSRLYGLLRTTYSEIAWSNLLTCNVKTRKPTNNNIRARRFPCLAVSASNTSLLTAHSIADGKFRFAANQNTGLWSKNLCPFPNPSNSCFHKMSSYVHKPESLLICQDRPPQPLVSS